MEQQPKTQFNLQAIFALTTAVAVWAWIFKDTSPTEMAALAIVPLVAGTIGHLTYTFVLPWRFTTTATMLILFNVVPLLLMLFAPDARDAVWDHIKFLIMITTRPAEMLAHARSSDLSMCIAYVLGTLLLTPANALKPCFPTAMISAIGLTIWYGVGVLILSHAG